MTHQDPLSSTEDRQKAIAKLQSVYPDFVELIAKFPVEHVQQRPVLNEREREIIAVACLAGLGTERLSGHLESALQAGISFDELAEVILQTSIYIGFPRAVDAMLQLEEIKRSINT